MPRANEFRHARMPSTGGMVARDAHRPLVRDRGPVEYFRGGSLFLGGLMVGALIGHLN